ncbi:polysaccharide biosynthesis/export family protein, partial [Thermodesulfobacteriota bacterium]
ISILIEAYKSKYATIFGQFGAIQAGIGSRAESGRIFLEGKTTLMDLIALASGFTQDADIKNTRILRGGRSYLVNLFDIIEKADETQNVIIDAGDIVKLPRLPEFGERVYVMGEVKEQGVYALKNAQDLVGAVALAEGFTNLAKEENTLIVRQYEPDQKPLILMADMRAIFRQGDITQNIRLEDGDLVYVPRMVIGDINQWIANISPMLNLLLYPAQFQSAYFNRKYLHIDRSHNK